MEVPKSLVAREAKNIHDELYPKHDHAHHQHAEAEMASFNEIAKKRVALGLLIAEYAKQASLQPEKERVTQRIKQIAAAYENPQEVAEWLSTDERLGGIEAQVMEDQVLEKLMEGLTLTEKSMTYSELK